MRPMQRCLGKKLQSTLEVGCGGVVNKLQSRAVNVAWIEGAESGK